MGGCRAVRSNSRRARGNRYCRRYSRPVANRGGLRNESTTFAANHSHHRSTQHHPNHKTPTTDAPLDIVARRTTAKPQPTPTNFGGSGRFTPSLPGHRSASWQSVGAVADVGSIRCSVVISACSEVARQPRIDRAGTSRHRHSLATIATRQDQTRDRHR
jgi:hypothetical protein